MTYQEYLDSAGSLGNTTQQAYNWFSNPFDFNNYSNGGAGAGNGGTAAMTNPFGLDTSDQYGVRNRNMGKDVFDSMTPQDWAAFKKMDGGAQNSFIEQRKLNLLKNNDAQSKAQSEQDRIKQEQQGIIDRVTKFADEMGMPVDELLKKDEFAKALQANTMNSSMNMAYSRGSGGGGISQLNADQSTKSALLGYQMQRQQAGQQALSNAYGMVNTMGSNEEGIRRYEQGLNLQLQQANAAASQQAYQQGMSQRSNTLGMVGGIFGGIYGGPTGAAAGQKLGSSIGGATYGTYTPYQYSYPGGGYAAGSGGIGGNSYGGGVNGGNF